MTEPKIVVYQYTLCAERTDDTLTWKDEDSINKLFLGFPWKEPLNEYNKRARFYWGFSISGHGEEVYPVIDAKVELSKPSMATPEFTLEMAVILEKLSIDQRRQFESLLDDYINDKSFKVWWDDDPRGPRKRSAKVKKKLIAAIKRIKTYDGSDDLKLEDVEVSLKEALEFFEYDYSAKTRDVKDSYKLAFKKLALKHHPDADTGSESSFIYLGKCRSVLETWIKR